MGLFGGDSKSTIKTEVVTTNVTQFRDIGLTGGDFVNAIDRFRASFDSLLSARASADRELSRRAIAAEEGATARSLAATNARREAEAQQTERLKSSNQFIASALGSIVSFQGQAARDTQNLYKSTNKALSEVAGLASETIQATDRAGQGELARALPWIVGGLALSLFAFARIP